MCEMRDQGAGLQWEEAGLFPGYVLTPYTQQRGALFPEVFRVLSRLLRLGTHGSNHRRKPTLGLLT